MSELLGSFEASTHYDNESGKWQAVIVEQYTTFDDIATTYISSELFDTHAAAFREALKVSRHLIESRQRIIDDELSKMRDWLDLSHEERTKRAKEVFPVGSPFRNQSDAS